MRSRPLAALVPALALASLACAAAGCRAHAPAATPPPDARAAAAAPTPPVAPRRDHAETWHGQRFEDPWFWLRERGDPEVRRYLEAENAYAAAVTRPLAPFADALYREMLGRIQQTDLSVPERRGRWHYYEKTIEGLQYPIRCRRAARAEGSHDPAAAEEVLLDPNALAAGRPFLGVHVFEPSDDGARLLYSTDEVGFRQYRLWVKDLATGAVQGPLAERVDDATWAADGRTVFYVTEDPVTKRADTVWRLELGGSPERVLGEPDALFRLGLSRTRDRRLLVVSSRSTDTWEDRILEADRPRGAFRAVVPREKGHKYETEHRAGLLYLRTNRGAKNFRVVTAPLDDPSPSRWRPFVDGRPDVLVEDVALFRGHAVVATKRAGLTGYEVHDFARGTWRAIGFPEPVYTARTLANPEHDTSLFRYAYESFTTPPSVFELDLATGGRALLKEQPVLGGYDRSAYASERLWVTARDGARVPVSLVRRVDVPRDGRAPLWLAGYGAYGFGLSARFEVPRLSLLDRGVVFAIAHVRGGDEMGEAWHDDGMLLRKKNTFRDFVDVAEALAREGWGARDRILAEGGSAGGLLMGAVVNDRPDLFRAVHAAVPFVDVVNTMMDASLPLTVGEYLEWGDPRDPAAFEYIRSYSPYDNVAPRPYPALLVTTSFFDSQVMYWEPAKWVAKLRATKAGASPLVLRTKLEPAGHGGASGRYDRLRDRALELAWMMAQVGVTR